MFKQNGVSDSYYKYTCVHCLLAPTSLLIHVHVCMYVCMSYLHLAVWIYMYGLECNVICNSFWKEGGQGETKLIYCASWVKTYIGLLCCPFQ